MKILMVFSFSVSGFQFKKKVDVFNLNPDHRPVRNVFFAIQAYTGVRICGDKSELVHAVYLGASVQILSLSDGFIIKITRVEVSSDSSFVYG